MAGIVDVAKKAAELVKQNQSGGMANRAAGGASGAPAADQTAAANTNSSPDYSIMINQAIKDGASADYVQSLVDLRSEKIAGDSSLAKYSGDQVFQDAYEYINTQKAKNQAYNANQIYNNAMSQYQSAQKAQQQAIEAAIDRNIKALKERIPEIERQTANANTGAYNSYLKAVDPFGVNAQKEAYLGINDTGYTETNRARLGNTYQGAVNTNEAQKIKLIENIYSRIEDARLSGDIEKANALAAYAKQIADLQITQGTALLENSLAEYQNKLSSEQYERQLAMQKAETLAQYGDFSGYAALGYSDEQIANMKSAYQAQQTAAAARAYSGGRTRTYTGGGTKKEDGKSKITYSEINNALYSAGIRTEGAAYAWLMDNGLTSSEATKYAKYYMDAYNAGLLNAKTGGFESEWVNAYCQELLNSLNDIPSTAEIESFVSMLADHGASEYDQRLFAKKLGAPV